MEKEIIFKEVIDSIVRELTKKNIPIGDLGDVGNIIGVAVGKITCKSGTIQYFEEDDFNLGFNHGYSLMKNLTGNSSDKTQIENLGRLLSADKPLKGKVESLPKELLRPMDQKDVDFWMGSANEEE